MYCDWNVLCFFRFWLIFPVQGDNLPTFKSRPATGQEFSKPAKWFSNIKYNKFHVLAAWNQDHAWKLAGLKVFTETEGKIRDLTRQMQKFNHSSINPLQYNKLSNLSSKYVTIKQTWYYFFLLQYISIMNSFQLP